MGEKSIKRRSFWGGILVGVLITGMILSGLFVYDFTKIKSGYESVLQAAYAGQYTGSNSLATAEFAEKVEKIYSTLEKDFYYTEDINPDKMKDMMYKAILKSTGDNYAEYYTAEEYRELMDDSEGIYYGIGSTVKIDEKTNYPMLAGVFTDSPASRAGLLDGDIIYKVDGVDVGGMTLTEVVKLIKGPENTEVLITIYRQGKEMDVTVIRGRVVSPLVEHEMLSEDIGYISLSEFDTATYDQFVTALKDVKKNNAKGLIIDLRDNGGGNLSTVLQICEELLPKGLITYVEYKDKTKDEYFSSGKNEIKIPIVVLTNGNTASASELMTGALRDYEKATIIGTKTFGKGIVQTIRPLGDGTAVKYTTASYFTPKGECIHKIGILPDIELEFDSDTYYSTSGQSDNQKEYALKYLTELIGK